MKLRAQFATFDQNIVLTNDEDEKLKKAKQELQDNLDEYSRKGESDFDELIIGNFVQGSYQRKTCLKQQEGKLPDIDIVVITKMDEDEFDPARLAQEKFLPFVEAYYPGKYEQQGRSIGVTLDGVGVDLDIVITSNPKESETGFLTEDLFKNMGNSKEWDFEDLEKAIPEISKLTRLDKSKSILNESIQLSEVVKDVEPLRIPDQDADRWQNTNPMAQIVWAVKKNAVCRYKYLPLVRALKWMRSSFGGFPKYPKGYPLEHIIGDNCPNDFSSTAEGLVTTLSNIITNYKLNYDAGAVPYLRDRGVDEDVLSRQTFEDFKSFYERIIEAHELAQKAILSDDSHESSKLWRDLLGEEFPLIEPGDGKWAKPDSASEPEKPRRFA